MGFMNKLRASNKKKPSCIKCGLHTKCDHPKIPVTGLGRQKILIINDCIGDEDDRCNTHLSGDEDYIPFYTTFKKFNLDLHNDCWRTSMVNCYPRTPGGLPRKPTAKEYVHCRPFWESHIKELKPRKIVLLGKDVCEKFYKDRLETTISIPKTRGTKLYDEKWNAWVFPIPHPGEIRANSHDKIIQEFYEKDIQLMAMDDTIVPVIPNVYKKIKLITDLDEILKTLRDLLRDKPYFAFDYETTGIKPYLEGHKILTVGVATATGDCFAFPMQHKFFTKDEQTRITRLWAKIMEDNKIRKIVHNLNFEFAWTSYLCNCKPRNIFWDTQLAAHILDNRRGITSLKFQLFKRYGIGDYDKKAKKYIKAHGDNPFNRMEQMPIKDILTYNAIDALGTLWLYEDQKKEVKGGRKKALNLMYNGSLALAKIHLNGMKINVDYYKNQLKLSQDKGNTLQQELLATKEAKLFKKISGRVLNITSLDDLKLLFYDDDYLGMFPTKLTDKGNASLDEEVLVKIGSEFTLKILEFRKNEKMGGTYLKGIIRETFNGTMNPFFNLNIPVSYRSSSSGINFQNLPKRDDRAMKIIRSGIVPDDDCLIVEADFSGAEVITSVCYHKDENFYNYLVDKTTDMHRDNASDIFLFEPEELNDPHHDAKQKKAAKLIRFYAKNMWTFAQFYGDWYGSCAPNLWENVVEAGLLTPQGITVEQHLRNRGINTYEEFEKHCATVEDKMWNERFPTYTKWKDDIVKQFMKDGYIETFLGFQFTMIMDKKQCNNYPIQGTSFHMLLYTLVRVQNELERRGMKTKIIGQIHDSIIANVHGSEFKEYKKILKKIVGSLQRKFDWLIVPMEIEMEISKLGKCGGNFAEMLEIKI